MEKLILENLCKTDSTRSIAEKLKVSQSNIRYWLNKHQLQTLHTLSKNKINLKQIYNCLYCGNEKLKTRNTFGKYCNNKCQMRYEHDQYISRWKSGLESGCNSWNEVTEYIRKYLLEKFDYSCSVCKWNDRHPADNKPLVEINHIDGNSSNCVEENLEVLCPNCHSKTATHGARNKQSARPKRKILKANLA